jgi:hypothetical protein
VIPDLACRMDLSLLLTDKHPEIRAAAAAALGQLPQLPSDSLDERDPQPLARAALLPAGNCPGAPGCWRRDQCGRYDTPPVRSRSPSLAVRQVSPSGGQSPLPLLRAYPDNLGAAGFLLTNRG